jgi:pilus assembly protein CpaF
MEGDVITMQEIFRFRQTGIDPDGQVLGKFEAVGIRPRFAEHLAARGSPVAAEMFRPEARFEQ